MGSSRTTVAPPSNRVRLIVASSVMLTFISFWRAAAIVLNDLGSSAFYAGGIAENAVGASAPWFILGIMLFSFAVRAVYVESCSMFTRGGVYRVVKEALGGTFARPQGELSEPFDTKRLTKAPSVLNTLMNPLPGPLKSSALSGGFCLA